MHSISSRYLLKASLATACALALACVAAGNASGASPAPVPTLHVSDLFRPHNDPDDHWDLATQYALALQDKLDLRGVMIDFPQPKRNNTPDICAVAQMNHITGKAVPIVVGSPRVPSAEELRTGATAADLAGVRAFLELMRQSPRPMVIHVIGSCRDVALAMRLEPKLFARRCAGIYLNAGSGTPDREKARQLEWNVNLDPASYAAMFEAPCPVYWLPCFEVVSSIPTEMWRVAAYGSFYRFRQSDILPHLSDRVQNFFMAMYAGGKTADGFWLQELTMPKNAEALAAQGKRDRNMWCTAGFLHAAGLTVTKSGEIAALKSARDAVFAFEPIRVKCSASGVTEWTKDARSKNRFILRVTDVEHYQSAMTTVLKSLLVKLP
ncbi:MAG: nucleoside hydrolase [Verrucomicrobia bacterium]|nr:nucleoside hydrolase [Verrucomicrobiota bacterium]